MAKKIDISKMTPLEADALSVEVGNKIREICDKAVKEANQILNIYSMQAKMAIVVEQQEQKKSKKTRKASKEL